MKILKQRRLKFKTDYKARLALLKSGKPRLVIRKTNKHIIVQILESNVAQDSVIFGDNSNILLSYGWPKELSGSLKSLSAAYLTGFAVGKKAQGKVKEAILDLGMHRNIHKSRIYAALKGAIDSGLKVPHKADSLPSMEQIKLNPKTSKVFDSVLNKINSGK